MIDFVLLLVVGSVWIWGIYCLFSEGYILEIVGNKIESIVNSKWVIKPLFGCPPCMGSIHGFFIAFIYYDVSWIIIPYCVSLCGLNFIIKTILYPEYEY